MRCSEKRLGKIDKINSNQSLKLFFFKIKICQKIHGSFDWCLNISLFEFRNFKHLFLKCAFEVIIK
jgi:hypothetical protein